MRSIVFRIALSVSMASSQVLGQQKDCSVDSKRFSAAREDAGRLLASGATHEALTPLKLAFGMCPDDVNNARELASASIEAGDLAYSEKLLKELLRRQDEAELHSLLGRAFTEDKSYQNAATQYQIAATMEPTEIHIFDFGTSLMKINFGAANEILRYGLKTYPASVRMHAALALALYAQDRPEEGAQLLCAASALDPADVHPMEVLADTRIVPGSVRAEVERRLDELRLHHPEDGLLLFDDAMVKSGRWSGNTTAKSPELVELLHKALALDPKLAKAHFELALVYDEERNYSGEIAELIQAIRLNPNAEQIHYRLAFAYRAVGDTPRFREELDRYRSLHASAEALH